MERSHDDGGFVDAVGTGVSLGPATARLLLATKNPHADRDACLGAILARCMALGLDVHTVRRTQASQARELAAALYGSAWLHFERGPLAAGSWEAVERRFSGERFRNIFGVAFSRDLVVSASSLLKRANVSEQRLLEIWNEGRRPLSRADLEVRYGASTARLLARDEPSFDWFHCPWPIGIQQISSGFVVFALRHPELLDGKPLLVINGHCLALADRFQTDEGRGSVLIEVGAAETGPEVSQVRSWLVGDDNRPDRCAPGTIRHDAASGDLPIAESALAVSPWANILHCSDGYFAGMAETAAALGGPPRGRLRATLDRMGYSDDEVRSVLMRDPVVTVGGTQLRLSERTRGMPLDRCAETISRYFPPVFGPRHGYGAGLAPGRLMGALQGLRAVAGSTEAFSRVFEQHRPIERTPPVPEVARLVAAEDEAAGVAALADGRVGLLVPAGGTGGRFGGYHLPESDARRHKPLAPVFTAVGRPVCALDIRAANARHWSRTTGGAVPVAVLASPSTRVGVRAWAAGAGAAGLQVSVYEQSGVYRFRKASMVGAASEARDLVEDFLLRDAEGRPSGKPPGTLGLITAFVIGGLFQEWTDAGIEFVALANSDDVGFRIDPAIVGLLERRPDVEALVLVAPAAAPGRSAKTKGGFLGEVLHHGSWQTCIIDGAAMANGEQDRYPYLNTNQIYLRMSALHRLFPGRGPDPRAEAARRVRDALPLFAEEKTVLLDGAPYEVLQLFQPVGELLRALHGVTAAVTSWQYTAARRGAHVPIKVTDDVAAAQCFLDEAAAGGDETQFD
ncbi:UTP--glucose-1-phosphate uridylyltransferase [Streptomyces sp. NPDC060275]|uniref:UTP--glucose-1-phosphate uridylyltransferase n=1 Tax=Streptomyces sp. NPDC060275 TaxID=3347090 RepID=UPI00364E7501